MEDDFVISEEFYISWVDENDYVCSRSYSKASRAKKQLALLQKTGCKYPIQIGVMQTKFINLLEIPAGDASDYSEVFERPPLDN